MAIIKNKLYKDYTMIPNWVISDPNISNNAFRLLIYLYSKPDNWNVRQTNIAKDLQVGRTTINNWLNELKDKNVVQVKRVGSSYEYHLQTDECSVQDVGVQDVGQHNKTDNIIRLNNNNTNNNQDIEVLDIYFNDNDLNVLYHEYLNMRKEKKNKATNTTISRQIKMLNKYSIEDAKQILNQSIINGWIGLFENRNNKQKNNKSLNEEIEYWKKL